MNRKYYTWFAGSLFIYSVLFYFVTHARYLYNDKLLYITVLEYDVSIYASFLVSFLLMGLVSLFFILIKLMNRNLIYSRLSIAILLLPIFPALGGLIRTVFALLRNHTNTFYWGLGEAFTLANNTSFPESMTINDLIAVGKSLMYGGGLFLSIVLLVSIIVNQVVVYLIYYKKYIKDFV